MSNRVVSRLSASPTTQRTRQDGNRSRPFKGARIDISQTASSKSLIRTVEAEARFAYQPIVDPYTGALYGVEALLRGHDKMGFGAIHEVFDAAFGLECLHHVELMVRERAMRSFLELGLPPQTHLFLNIDNRVVASDDYKPGSTLAVAEKVGFKPGSLCIEVSERHSLTAGGQSAISLAQQYRRQSFRVAIDDFGTGYAGLKLLYEQYPDYVKIDRFFIAGVSEDRTKQLFLSQIANLCQTLGIAVIAEGVETEDEFRICKEMGYNLIQGYYVQRPTEQADELRPSYTEIVGPRERRSKDKDRRFIDQELLHIKPLPVDTKILDVLEWFGQNRERTFFPVVDDAMEPLGIICEEDLKQFTYSRYGKELLSNTTFRRTLSDFLRPSPVADIRDGAERILEKFTLNDNQEGIIVVENMRYIGFLSAGSLLRVVNEKNLAMARDENPLSKLPGNNRIMEYVAGAIDDTEQPTVLVYFDFDNFKPFNDTYGFRQGDRAILLFADLMRKFLDKGDVFCGHIGGDDFFAGIRGLGYDEAISMVRGLRHEFCHQVETFYDKEARDAGGICAKDRYGRMRSFPLLAVSCAVLELPPSCVRRTAEELTHAISELKKEAKCHPEGVVAASQP